MASISVNTKSTEIETIDAIRHLVCLQYKIPIPGVNPMGLGRSDYPLRGGESSQTCCTFIYT